MNDSSEALIFGFQVSAEGTVKTLAWEDLAQWSCQDSTSWTWLHLNRHSPRAHAWLSEKGAPDSLVEAALLQQDTRPRIVRHNDGYLLNLRGVNLNPGASPEDMISLRMWATKGYVITSRASRVLAAEDVKTRFESGNPPNGTGGLIALLAQRLVVRMGPVISELDEEVDDLEDRMLQNDTQSSMSSVNRFRRTVLALRRYLAPQREAIGSFQRDSDGFLTREEQHSLRDTHDTLVRHLEDLDMIRDRALLLQEQMVEERAEAMNTRLFVLAVISAVFLPLGFITGLFGVNVGGMPGVDTPLAFTLLCVGIVVFSVGIVWWFRRLKWL